jgi:hypothetical protein
MKNLLSFGSYEPGNSSSSSRVNSRINESNLFESVKNIDFTNLNEQEKADLDRLAEEHGICTFDLICMREGIGYDSYGQPLNEEEIDAEYESIDEGFLGGLLKVVKNVIPKAKSIIAKAKPLFQKGGKISQGLQGAFGKVQAGIAKLAGKSKNLQGLIKNADSNPELAQSADASQEGLGKVLADLKANGAKAFFSPDNAATVQNVASLFNSTSQTASEIKKAAPKLAEPEDDDDDDDDDDDESGL